MKYRIFFTLVCLSNLATAQQWASPNLILPNDTLLQRSVHKADSITHSFQTKADSLNSLYQKQFSKIDSECARIQSKIDSLNNFQLPIGKLTKKLDSLNQIKAGKISSLTKKIDDLKAKATGSLKEVTLPPQMQEPMDKLKMAVQDYSIPTLNPLAPGMPSLDMPGLGNTQLPSLGNNLLSDSNLKNITYNLGKVNDVMGKAGEYSQDAQNLVKGNLNEIKSIDKTIEGKLAGMEGMEELSQGKELLGQTSQLTDSAALANKAKEIVTEQVMNAAQDHFAGKQELLQQAMDKMSKLKNRYSEVKSMAELPKRLPNPLKGKPFIERIVPAITFQILKSNYFLLDVNPMVMYRISPRISAGAGWNHRLPFDDLTIRKEQSVYGPRVALEVKWTRGINFLLIPEIMNTTIPPYVASGKGITDPAYREWVPGLFVGIKKDFTVYKQIKGNSEVLYNLYDPDDMSPYEEFSVRFGFEFPMRKKQKK